MRLLKYIGWTLAGMGGLVLVAAAGLAAVSPASSPPSAEQVQATPQRLERGSYLFNHVMACGHCHSERDFSVFGGPERAGTRGGGACFPEAFGMPGKVCAQNITPHPEAGLGGWSDGELMRAIREGVGRDGRALFMMTDFRAISDEDLRALVVYLRSLPPLPSDPPPTELIFPLNLLIKLETEAVPGPVAPPSRQDPQAYGRYLASLAGCGSCHSGEAGEFAGGGEFTTPYGTEVAVDLRPVGGKVRGLAREDFIALFKAMGAAREGAAGKALMPWRSLAGMAQEDLGALYDFLTGLPPGGEAPLETGAGAAAREEP